MPGLLGHIVGQMLPSRYEEAASAGLEFLLNEYPRLRSGFLSAVGFVKGPSSETLQVRREFTLGVSGPGASGRPDLAMLGRKGRPRVLVESKFMASLTARQPTSYIRALGALEGPRALVFLVPEWRVGEIFQEIQHRLSKEGMDLKAIDPCKAATRHRTDEGTEVAIMTWRRLCEVFKETMETEDIARRSSPEGELSTMRADLIQFEGMLPMSENSDFDPIKPNEFEHREWPRRLQQIHDVVQAAISLSEADQVVSRERLRATSTATRSGHYILFTRSGEADLSPSSTDALPGAFLGVDFEAWATHGQSAVWLRFPDSDWGKADRVIECLNAEPRAQGGHRAVRGEVGADTLCPVSLKEGVPRDAVVQGIVKELRRVRDLLAKPVAAG